ncbi:hypothetical protein ACFLSU_01745, partial [Bacteroidota bacterium]
KLSFELKNCKNKTIYKSAIGSSSEKDFKKGYQESLRNAFKDFKKLKYKYSPKAIVKLQSEAVLLAPNAILKNNVYTSVQGLSIELQENNGNYIGKVVKSSSLNYSEGQIICKLFKTSLKNVYKAQWKDTYGNFVNTIGYFDTDGNLNVDLAETTGITVLRFTH